MKRRLKLKVNGESPRSLLIAFVLAKLNCDIYLNDSLKNSNSKKDNQLFLFSNSLKNLLNEFDIWSEIENISYAFTSLSIKDNLVFEQLLFRSENFSRKNLNSVGWTANYSDIKRLLISKLMHFENIHFISKNKLVDQYLIYDYEFNFKNYDNFLMSFKWPLLNFKRIDEQILVFNIYLRGNVEKRLYEINTARGLIILTPFHKNLYQVIWKNASFRIKETSRNSKSFFVDNLTTLLPNELIIDQIIGDINYLHSSKTFSSYLVKNKSFYINENKSNSNIIYDFNFDIVIRNILKVYNFIEKKESSKIKILNKLGFNYFYRKCLELFLNYSFSNFLFSLFTVNNIFSLIIRKLLFSFIKRTNLLNTLFMRNPSNLNINNLIKL